jgi:hypothetical protein
MTVRTRHRLIALSIIAAPFVFLVCLLLFWDAEPLPPVPPLPNPNGYDDLVKAGQMITGEPGDYNELNKRQLGELVATNAGALQLLHAGLSNQCQVPVQFSPTYWENHLGELADIKRSARILAAEGKLSGMQGHPNDAAKYYLEAIHLGNESARGGVLIDQLVGTAIESIGVRNLQTLIDQLDAKSCRETATTLETLDSQRQTWDKVMQQERAWSRRAFPGVRYELMRLMNRHSLEKVFQNAGQKFDEQQSKTRQLIIEFAARAYQLDKGHPPANLADLVPDYLNAIPQDPLTGTNMVYSP